MNSFLLLYDMFLFFFWKKLKTPKRPFEINWPLVGLHMRSVTNFLFPGCFEGTKVLLRRVHTKGGVISESFSIWLKSPKKVPNHDPEHYPPKTFCTVFFGYLSQSENPFEIIPPLQKQILWWIQSKIANLSHIYPFLF